MKRHGPLHYNHIAGESLERLAALSDGIFGVAMTLLVLDLRTPAAGAIHSELGLWHGLALLLPSLVTYMLSFLTAGIFWISQQTQFNYMDRSDRNFTWIQIAFLFAVTLLPFSTAVLSAFIRYRAALLVYWFNIALLGAVFYWGWLYALRRGLVKDGTGPAVWLAIGQRAKMAQALYAFGAALCAVNTFCSIGFIVLVQLNYAVGLFTGIGRESGETGVSIG